MLVIISYIVLIIYFHLHLFNTFIIFYFKIFFFVYMYIHMWALGSGLSGKVLAKHVPWPEFDSQNSHEKKNRPGLVVYTFNVRAGLVGTGRSQGLP